MSNESDRRRHILYVTQNTEYHLRDDQCVGVRDLWTGRWKDEHPAVGKKLFGAVSQSEGGLEPINLPEVNSLLWFDNGESDIFTSRLTTITRPPKNAVARYDELLESTKVSK